MGVVDRDLWARAVREGLRRDGARSLPLDEGRRGIDSFSAPPDPIAEVAMRLEDAVVATREPPAGPWLRLRVESELWSTLQADRETAVADLDRWAREGGVPAPPSIDEVAPPTAKHDLEPDPAPDPVPIPVSESEPPDDIDPFALPTLEPVRAAAEADREDEVITRESEGVGNSDEVRGEPDTGPEAPPDAELGADEPEAEPEPLDLRRAMASPEESEAIIEAIRAIESFEPDVTPSTDPGETEYADLSQVDAAPEPFAPPVLSEYGFSTFSPEAELEETPEIPAEAGAEDESIGVSAEFSLEPVAEPVTDSGTDPGTDPVDVPVRTPVSVLRGQGLTKAYRSRKVVDNVEIEVAQGEIVGLLGPNGAGKTTSFYMMVGLIAPDRGKVFLDSKNISRMPMYKRARMGVGYLAQEPSVFRKLSVEDNVLAILETLGLKRAERKKRLEELLAELSITHLRKSKAYSLSGGERRRLEITRALVQRPRFMLLDEPFAGIDPIAVSDIQQIVAALKTRGIGVMISDHNVEQTLEIVDRAYIMYEGQIRVSGSVSELVWNDDVAEIYLGPTLTARMRKRFPSPVANAGVSGGEPLG